MTLDVSKSDGVTARVNEVYRTYGRIDILVNNAGILKLAPIIANGYRQRRDREVGETKVTNVVSAFPVAR